MQIKILKTGLLDTVQDLGRDCWMHLAVPISGVMDTLSGRIANRVIGNNDNDAVIEITYGGIAFTAETDLLIAYMGGGSCLRANQIKLPTGRPLFVPKGTQLNFTTQQRGSRNYLAIAGGWNVPEVLNSKSTCLIANFGGYKGRALQQDDLLVSNDWISDLSKHINHTLKGKSIRYPLWSVPEQYDLSAKEKTIRIIPAHEFNWFNGLAITSLLTEPFKLNLKNNRMGYHLDGPLMQRLNNTELLSTAVTPGTIQVTGNGSLILLMCDCQTTGGYPRIAQVATVDMPLCAQLNPGDELYFKVISWTEAENLYLEQESDLQQISNGIKNKYL